MTTLASHEPSRRPPIRRGAAGSGPTGPAGRRPAPERPAGRDSADDGDQLRRLAAGFAQAFLEVECGRRPRAQLRPVLCARLAGRLADVWLRPGPPGQVIHAHGAQVAPDRYEAVALVRRGQRFGALVVSLARNGAGWQVVEAARPEDAFIPSGPSAGLGRDARGGPLPAATPAEGVAAAPAAR